MRDKPFLMATFMDQTDSGKLKINCPTFCNPDALERASAHQHAGEYAAAETIYKEILKLNPGNTRALFDYGMLAQNIKSYENAVLFFSETLRIDKNFAAAYRERGRAFQQLKKFREAFQDYEVALSIDPYSFDTLVSRGLLFCQKSEFNKAIDDFTRAIQLKARSADAHYNRALAFQKLDKLEMSILDYTQSININPSNFRAYNNRGLAYRDTKLFHKAIKDFDKSIALKPDLADAYWNKALTHLMIGDFENAWQYYEHRWESPNFTSPVRNFPQPLWLGKENLKGKTILLHSEQGLGDSLQFCRYIKKFKTMDCTTLLEIERPLISIMKCLLPEEQIFEKGSRLPKFDFHCPLLSLPLAFGTTFDSIPYPRPYLSAESVRLIWWRERLGKKTKPRVGLVWQGNSNHSKDQYRSVKFDTIAPHLLPDFDWYSLQFDISEQDEKLIDQIRNLTHFGKTIGDFSETAALCKLMDRVVCVDTSIAHLAGAIGCNVDLMLCNSADARWHASGDKSPWYSRMQIHRKNRGEDWSPFFKRVVESIRQIELSNL